MSDNAELATVLRRVAELLSRDDPDANWYAYRAGDLRSKVNHFLQHADADLPLSETEHDTLRSLFAPNGPLQETSMASGWPTEFLTLAARFDDAI